MEYKARVSYKEKEWLVVDSFEYENKSYMYLVEDVEFIGNKLDELKSDEEYLKNLQNYPNQINIIFIEKLENGNYITVEDENTINKLNDIVATRFLKTTMENE